MSLKSFLLFFWFTISSAQEFTMLNQTFQQTKKTMDNKPANNSSKEEIDNFNKLVGEMNKEVGIYNRNSNQFNTERTNIINNWNVTGDNFIAKYVPID